MTLPDLPVRWSRPRNQLASLSIVLGLASVALVFWRWIPIIGLVFSVAAIIVAIPAVVTGYIALQRAHDLSGEGRGLALTGLVSGYFTMAFAIVMPVVSAVLLVMGAAGFAQDNLPYWLNYFERLWSEVTDSA